MDIRFDGMLAVVTGGAGGIGSVCAKTLLTSGAAVALVDVSEDALNTVCAELKEFGTVQGFRVDISDVASISDCIRKIRSEMGEIDILIQTAGLLRSKPALEIDQNDWDLVMNVNARGMFFFMQQTVLQSMMKRGGSIVNFASMAALRGFYQPMSGIHYGASKGAVISMSTQAAVEWAEYGVRVNAVAPGGVMTKAMEKMNFPKDAFQMIPAKRLSTPQEIAESVAFLASEQAAMITGQTLLIDGGGCVVGF